VFSSSFDNGQSQQLDHANHLGGGPDDLAVTAGPAVEKARLPNAMQRTRGADRKLPTQARSLWN